MALPKSKITRFLSGYSVKDCTISIILSAPKPVGLRFEAKVKGLIKFDKNYFEIISINL